MLEVSGIVSTIVFFLVRHNTIAHDKVMSVKKGARVSKAGDGQAHANHIPNCQKRNNTSFPEHRPQPGFRVKSPDGPRVSKFAHSTTGQSHLPSDVTKQMHQHIKTCRFDLIPTSGGITYMN